MEFSLILERNKSTLHSTTGNLLLIDNKNRSILQLRTLERPWVFNERKISCIPTGTYIVKRHTSPKFGTCFKIQDVKGRSDILIHSGNAVNDTLGCILVGLTSASVDGNVTTMLYNSRKAMTALLALIDRDIVLHIRNTVLS
jgi:hypothetical protein